MEKTESSPPPERNTKEEEPELPLTMRQPQADFYFSEFLQLLKRDDFLLARACNRVVVGHEDKDSDAINAMVALFDHHGDLMGIVNSVVSADLKTSSGSFPAGAGPSLFPLADQLRLWLRSSPELGHFVLDVFRALRKPLEQGSPEVVDRNLSLARKALKIISGLEVPSAIRLACRETARLSVLHGFSSSMDEAAQFSVGSILFLHFVCPALISMNSFLVVAAYMAKKHMEDIPFETTRAMVMVAKLLQALANGSTKFDNPSMEPYNCFLTEEKATFRRFCCEVVNFEAKTYERHTLPDDKLMRRWKLMFRFAKRRKEEVVGMATELGSEELVARISADLTAAIDSVSLKRELARSQDDIRDAADSHRSRMMKSNSMDSAGGMTGHVVASRTVSSPSPSRSSSHDTRQRATRRRVAEEPVRGSKQVPASPKGLARTFFRRKSHADKASPEKPKDKTRKSSLSGRYGL